MKIEWKKLTTCDNPCSEKYVLKAFGYKILITNHPMYKRGYEYYIFKINTFGEHLEIVRKDTESRPTLEEAKKKTLQYVILLLLDYGKEVTQAIEDLKELEDEA